MTFKFNESKPAGILFCATAFLCASCTPSFMRKSADNEVQRIFFWKSKAVPNDGTSRLDITPPPPITLNGLAKNANSADFLGNRAQVEMNSRVIPLADALGMAVTHNRTYRDTKESLFLQALDLTLTRNDFAPIFYGTGSAGVVNSTLQGGTSSAQTANIVASAKTQTAATKAVTSGDSTTSSSTLPRTTTASASAVPRTTTTSASAVPRVLQKQINTLVADNTFTARGSTGVELLTRTGARLAMDFTSDFMKFLTGNLTKTSDSTLVFSLTQPLLRGAGYRATMENLTQSERDLMYAIRDFTQYRKTFAVDITTQYYKVLESRTIARNNHFAYKAFEKILESQTALANNDRIKLSQLGQIQQASLKFKTLWVTGVRTYEQNLDDLKIALGVPVQEPVILDEKELASLDILDPGLSLEEAAQVAMVTRLDLDNARNSIEDKKRKIKIAEQNLLPQLDIAGGYTVGGRPNSEKVNLDPDRRRFSGGAVLDLRLNKKPDRNDYRSALVQQQKAERDLDLAEENIKAQIRADYRDLDLASKQFEFAETGMKLSQRRLEYEDTLRELGQGTARDLIEAQQDLINATILLTSARISHTIARMKLWRDMGVLFIRKDGTWERVMTKAELSANE
jgi:outer membrane protein TolC